MKICVFGASGYVGASLYEKLEKEWKTEVVGTYLDMPQAFENLTKLDVNEPESFSAFFKKEQPDVVVWSLMSGPNEFKLINEGLIHLITHLTPRTRLIYLSSDFVYTQGKGPYTEKDPISSTPNDQALSNYANAKVKAEHFITNELTNYVILRCGPVYGENAVGNRDNYLEKIETVVKAGESVAYRDDLIRTFIKIDDLADLVVDMVRMNIIGTYNIGEKESKSFYQFMREQAEIYGYDPELIKIKENIKNHYLPKNIALITDKMEAVLRRRIR